MKGTLKKIIKNVSSSEVGGAMIFGVDSNVVKAHGNSNADAIMNAIKQARTMVDKNIIDKVMEKLPENIDIASKEEEA
jgi:glycerol-3-phosphate acyltransferase PlsX